MDKKTIKKTRENDNDKSMDNDTDNVDKIRDILFGNQIREFEQKFSRLEQRINDELSSLRKESTLQIESLQSYIDSEISIVSSKLKSTEDNGHQEMDKLDLAINQNRKAMDSKVKELASVQDKQATDINQKILKQSQDFTSEMNKQFDLIKKRLEEYRQDLSSGKVDKSALSEMLNNLAIQVNSEN